MNIGFYIILLLVLIACQPAKKNLNTSQKSDHQELIKEKLGGEYETQANGNGSHLLCLKFDKSRPGRVDFLVYDLTNQKIIFDKKLENGRVEWETDTAVKIMEGKGNRTKDYPEGYRTYYFDVTGEKIIDKISKNN